MPLAIIGARIYYVAFEWEYYKDNPTDIIAIWNGGIAIHGALIASVIVVYVLPKSETRHSSKWRIFWRQAF